MRLVYLSPVAWGFHAHRPHRLVEWFHRETGGEVLWVNPYPTRLPAWRDFRHLRKSVSVLKFAKPPWLTILQPRALPIEPLPGVDWANRKLWRGTIKTIESFAADGVCLLGIGKPSDFALHLLGSIRMKLSFFDAMDDFPAFYYGISQKALLKRELAIASNVSMLLTSSTALMRKWRGVRKDVVLALNGCDVDAFPPPNTREGCFDDNLLGYVGTVGEWFDWDIVFELAKVKPMITIHLIGPVVASLPDKIPHNVKMLGSCRNYEAIAAMEKFGIGIIPFKQTRLTESVDPIKYYEYRALGLPVISTRFGEMGLRKNVPGVFLVDSETDLESVLDSAAAYRMGTSEIERFRASNSWNARFASTGILS